MDNTSHDERVLLDLLAYAYLRHNLPDKAAALYRALTIIDPDSPNPIKGLAWAQLEAGDAAASLKALDTIVGPGEPSPVVQLLRARAFARLGRTEDSQVAMRAFLASRNKGTR